MQIWLLENLLIFKALHVISIVCWFAGLFYIPRLFVYHSQVALTETKQYEMFCTMERRLYKAIMMPSLIATFVTGLGLFLAMWEFYFQFIWVHVKLTLIIILVVYHFICGFYVKKFAEKQNNNTHVFYRFFNEFPTIILITIVFLVFIKPWS